MGKPETNERVALVTGSRTGIGEYLARSLAEKGYLVVGCSRQPADWTCDGYMHVLADVANEQDVRQLFTRVHKEFGRLDVTINNAGVASMNHSLLTPAATVDRLMNVNLRGTFLVSRESARLMQRRQFGRIVNMTTIAVPMQLEGEAIYGASKSAVETLTKVMARELAAFGITVNAIGPTPIDTALIRGVPAASIDAIIQRLAIKRPGTPRDVMNVVDFLISPETDYVTGQIIYLGGVS